MVKSEARAQFGTPDTEYNTADGFCRNVVQPSKKPGSITVLFGYLSAYQEMAKRSYPMSASVAFP